MADERRTLLIEARVNDFATKSFVGMGRAVKTFAATGIDSMRSFGRFITDTRNLVAGLFAFLAVRRTFGFVQGIADSVNEIGALSDQVGASVDSLQKLRLLADLTDTSFENLASKGLATLIRNLDEARTGSQEYALAAEKLGLSLENLPLGAGGKLDVIELLAQLADNSKKVTDRFQAQAAVQELFGRTGRDVNAVLALTGEEIRKIGAEAERRGIVFSTEDIERVRQFDDAMDRFSLTVKGVAQSLFIDAAPALTAFVSSVGDFVARNRDAIKGALEDVGRFIVQVVDTALQAIIKLVDGLESIGFDFASDDIERLNQQIAQLRQNLKDTSGGGGILNPFTGERLQADAALIEETRKKIAELEAQITKLRSGPGVAEKLQKQLDELRSLKLEFTATPTLNIPSTPELPDIGDALGGPQTQQKLLQVEQQLLRLQPQSIEVRERLAEIDTALARGKIVDDLQAAGLAGEQLAQSVQSAFNLLAGDLERTKQRIRADAAQAQRDAVASAETQITQLEQQLLRLQLPTREVQLRLAEIDTALAQQKLVADLEATKKKLEDVGLSAERFEDATRAAFNVLQGELEKTRRLLQGDFFLGFSEQLKLVIDQWTDMSAAGIEAANLIVHGGLNTISAELGNVIAHTKSWEDAMRDAARVIIQSLSQVIAKLLIVQTLQTLFGGFTLGLGGGGGSAPAAGFTPATGASPFLFNEKGGIVPGTMLAKTPLLGFENGGVIAGDLVRRMPLKMYEAGGIARSPQLAIFGEGKASKGEAFVPLPDGRTIPVTLRDARSRGDIVFNFSFQSMDSEDVTRVLMRSRHTIVGMYTQALSGGDSAARSAVKMASRT